MKETTKQSLAIVMITVFVAVAIFVVNKYTIESFNRYQELKNEILAKKETKSTMAKYKKVAEDLYTQYQAFGSDLEKIQTALPTKANLPEVVAALDSIARQTNIFISSFSFRELERNNLQAVDATNKYQTIEVGAVITGTYTDMVQFFAEIETELRLMDVVSLDIKNAELSTLNSKAKNSSKSLTANVLIYTYYQR